MQPPFEYIPNPNLVTELPRNRIDTLTLGSYFAFVKSSTKMYKLGYVSDAHVIIGIDLPHSVTGVRRLRDEEVFDLGNDFELAKELLTSYHNPKQGLMPHHKLDLWDVFEFTVNGSREPDAKPLVRVVGGYLEPNAMFVDVESRLIANRQVLRLGSFKVNKESN